MCPNQNLKLTNSDSFLSTENNQKISKHVRSFSDITDFGGKNDKMINKMENNQVYNNTTEMVNVYERDNIENQIAKEQEKWENLRTGDYSLTVEIIEAGK